MSLVYHETKSGLVLAERGGDEAALQRALKHLDPDLILVKEVDERYGAFVWKVLCWTGDDRPAVHVLDWRDVNGKPLPLTGRIIDMVDAQRKDRPGGYDAVQASDAANERLRERRAKEFDTAVEDVEQDFAATLERGRVSVAMGSDTKKRAWQRNTHLPAAYREVLK